MMTQTQDFRVAPHIAAIPRLPMGRMLTSAIPFIAVAIPGAAYAQDVENTATVAAPPGATDTDTSNNSATDTDTLLAVVVAENDDFTGTPILSTGGATSTVFVNDTLNGAAFADSAVDVTIVDDDGLTGVTIGTDGTITIPAGTPPGTYNVEYELCEAGTTNCDTAIATILVGGVADLQTIKVLGSGTTEPAVGDTVTFSITVTNNGGDTATNVTLTDALPAGLTATANNGGVAGTGSSTGGSYNATNGVWTIGTLLDGETATLTLEGTVDAGQEGNTITNVTTAATGDQNDPEAGGDDLDESVTVINTIIANNDDFSGTPILSTGGDTASVFSDDTLNGAAFADTAVIPTIIDEDGLTGITINADGTLSVPASSTPGTYDVVYQICEAADTDNCDTAIATIVVGGVANLQTVKVLASGTAEPGVGDTVTFEITVTNNGGDTATNVSLTDVLPAGLTATANNGGITATGSASGGTYAAGTGVWSVGTLLNGESATLTLEGTVNVGQEGNTITNVTTAAAGDQSDPSTVGDDLTEAVTVINSIIANNNDFSGTSIPSTGGSTASVFPNDTLNGATFADTAVIPTIVNDDGLTGVTINADGTLTVPSGATPGTYSVEYQICETADPDNCDTAIATVVVGAVVNLSIAKTNNVTEVRSGDTVTYVLTVANAGPDAAVGALVTDTPGPGLSCPANGTITFGGTAPAGAPAGTPEVGDLQGAGITLGTIGANQNVTITYSCSVN
ncbi:DUF11 domain-containing protein [Aurantiacibacter sediminis]|uniref:DUF11 domain-containing protein n=1 Tax=Aurantiacibacter sediminis TaxID=2793064 RepID=A0ABS0N1W9_9SPHN|nr:DUF11 domain-containing protein [Aurantiacibacter sediminis]MBH5321949.1 DUF11 domain-containing protein [Aurantiacibacter sediminis]